MSRRGEIVIECDTPTCHAEIRFEAWHRASTVDDVLDDAGWQVTGKAVGRAPRKDICPQCVEEANPREKGDDDGREYADPRDHLDGRE